MKRFLALACVFALLMGACGAPQPSAPASPTAAEPTEPEPTQAAESAEGIPGVTAENYPRIDGWLTGEAGRAELGRAGYITGAEQG